jgi:hypothetical protein
VEVNVGEDSLARCVVCLAVKASPVLSRVVKFRFHHEISASCQAACHDVVEHSAGSISAESAFQDGPAPQNQPGCSSNPAC